MSIRLDGENKAVEYSAVGAMKDAVRVVFRGPRVHDLFDRDWHKVALSVQAQNASLYVDCALVQTLPLEERENIDIQGKTAIGKRLYDSVPVDVSSGVAGSPQGRGPQEPGAPMPACITHRVVTVGRLRREGPGSDPCRVPSFTRSVT